MKEIFKPIYIGFMRMITLNFELWFKPSNLGWKRLEKEAWVRSVREKE